MASRHVRQILIGLSALAVIATVFSFAFVPVEMSQDEWWHLKTGKWIFEHGMHVPRNDVFAYASKNIRWDNHEWLAQVGMYLTWLAGEKSGYGPMRAVITAKTFVWLAALLVAGWAAWRRTRSIVPVLLIVLLAADVGRRTLQPRPPVLTYLFIAIFQYILVAWKAGRMKARYLFMLPVLMLLWANLHGGFILGGILIVCFFVAELIEAIWNKLWRKRAESTRNSLTNAGLLLLVGVLTGLCSLATPFGWRLYLLPLRVMRDKNLVELIWELQTPFRWPLIMLWPYLALAVLFVLGLLFFGKNRSAKESLDPESVAQAPLPVAVWPGEILWVLFLFWQSAQHLRHMPLFAIAAIPPCSAFVAAAVEKASSFRRINLKWLEPLLAIVTVALSLWWLLNHTERPESFLDRSLELAKGHAYRTDGYPVNLCDFLEDSDIKGRLFNDSRYAGYLIWRLSPERMRVFTDMRYDIFGGQFIPEDRAVRRGTARFMDEKGQIHSLDWRTVVNEWKADVLVLDKLEGRFENGMDYGEERPEWVIRQLENSPEWTAVYADPIPDRGLMVFIRNTPDNRAMIDRAQRIAPYLTYHRPTRGGWGQ